MPWSRRLIPLLLALALAAGSGLVPRAGAQAPSARFAFADTTLLRDTLDLHFTGLFALSESLRTSPDTLRALSIRYRFDLERLAFLADSLDVPVDSVGTVLERERFNPLAQRPTRMNLFSYGSTYTVNRQTSSWGNTVNYDFSRGPFVIHNATAVRVDRTQESGKFTFFRDNTSNTETGFRFSPDLSAGARLNLQETENFRLGSVRNTTNNQFQGSLRGRRQLAPDLRGELNLFGGPFRQPKNSVTTAAKQGFATEGDGRLQYTRARLVSFDLSAFGTLNAGTASLPERYDYRTNDLKWDSHGTVNLLPELPSSVILNYRLSGDRIERPVSHTQISPIAGSSPPASDTTVIDQLVQEPSGVGSLQASTRIPTTRYGSVTLTGSLDRTTRLLASERKEGIVFDRTETRSADLTADGQFDLGRWSLAGQFAITRPWEDNPRRSVVSVPQSDGTTVPVTVNYRERSTSGGQTLNGQLTRPISSSLSFKARAEVSLTSYRYDVTDSAYLATTDQTHVEPSDPRDDYRQSYRLEATYAPTNLSTTVALEVARVLTVYLKANRSATNQEDRVYRGEWLWTYQLFRELTANQRNQIISTYTKYPYGPDKDRLSMNYSTITTLNARMTPHLSFELTHTWTYGPGGSYLRATDGIEYFTVSDASREYSLAGRLGYTPVPAFTISVTPYYQATYRDDRSSGTAVTTTAQKRLSLVGGANMNLAVGPRGRLSGSINRTLETRRDDRYSSGVVQPQPRSEINYWNGALQFSWSL